MSALPLPRDSGLPPEDVIDAVADALESQGYILLPASLPEDLLAKLFVHFKSLDGEDFLRAGIGREGDYQVNRFIRSDAIRWLEPPEGPAAAYFQWMEGLRLGLNRRLFLGLFDYECHFAWYPPGAFYRKHLDAFQGDNCRAVSSVLYLNPDWMPGDGGELVLYSPDSGLELERVAPRYGTMVLFLSEDFPHEVMATKKARYSLTGWFRLNNSVGGGIDPPR